ncbi:MAG: FAD-containing oxidoreductase, partial [Proteobacteria bacterium]
KVTIIQNAVQLLPNEDADIASAIADVLSASGATIVLGEEVNKLERTEKGIRAICKNWNEEFSHLLVAAGQIPQTLGLGLHAAGVELMHENYVRTDEYMKTSNPTIYALGDCKGGPKFTHIAYDDARILCDGLLRGQWRSIEDRLVPYTVFLDPQLGRIGLTERQARNKGKKFDVVRLKMNDTARGIETGEEEGIWKILVERETRQILGGAFLSGEGGETMAVLQIAMMAKMPYSSIRDAIFAHPTWAESLNNVFLRLDKQRKSQVFQCSKSDQANNNCDSEGAFREQA